MRNTVIPGLAAIVLILLLYYRIGFLRRLLLIGLFCASVFICSRAFDAWWDHKFEETQQIVERLGGRPYKGFAGTTHFIWSSIYIGFSDFDDKFGIKWNDWDHTRLLRKAYKAHGIRAI